MAADRRGNLYLAWIAGDGSAGGGASAPGAPDPAAEGILGQGTPMLSVSRDGGGTWSPPVSIAPPGTAAARHIAVATGDAGHVAVSFLASTDGGAQLAGYLAETTDALARTPLWWAAALDDPRRPLLNASDSETFGDRLFFLTDTYAPTGQPWAAFHCAKTSACPGQRIGVVGQLAPAKAPPRRRVRRRRVARRRHVASRRHVRRRRSARFAG